MLVFTFSCYWGTCNLRGTFWVQMCPAVPTQKHHLKCNRIHRIAEDHVILNSRVDG